MRRVPVALLVSPMGAAGSNRSKSRDTTGPRGACCFARQPSFLLGAMLDEDAAPETSLFSSRMDLGNRLLENRGIPSGAVSFVDATERCRLSWEGYAVGAFDADGYPDLCVATLGPNVPFHNTGNGTLSRVGGPQDRVGASPHRSSTMTPTGVWTRFSPTMSIAACAATRSASHPPGPGTTAA